MEKNGMVTEDSMSDFDLTKKAVYYDEEGFGISDEANKHKLAKPQKLKDDGKRHRANHE